MFVVRDIMYCKPGKARPMAQKFLAISKLGEKLGYEMLKVTGAQFNSRAPSPGGDWHTGPRRQYVITLQGRGELEVANGQKVPVGPGHINLIEDTTGKGHITRNFGPEDRVVLTIPLVDQTIGGAR
jgi:quercetin dioxygenase-like cupin family protein